MKLTGRQRDVLSEFLDLYREYQEPLHYSLVAERLGVSSVTAYEMLRLLESRGLLRSEYVIPSAEGQGPGRSAIVFWPTPDAHALIASLVGDEWDEAEWGEVKAHILEELRNTEGASYEKLLEDILARLPDRRTPLLFATDMLVAIILGVLQVIDESKVPALLELLFTLNQTGAASLSRLSGLAVGLGLVEQANQQFAQLIAHIQGYQEAVARLSDARKDALADFARELLLTARA